MVEILAEGRWCVACQFFEMEDEYVESRCQSCGCAAGLHREAQVIVAVPME